MLYKRRFYTDPHDRKREIPASSLKKMRKKQKISVMKYWFLERFENPVNGSPYETAEGGYIFIWGGPFDASEQLAHEFSGRVSEKIIADTAQELETEHECYEWTYANVNDEPEEFYEIDATLDDKTPLGTLQYNLMSMKKLLKEKDLMDESLHRFQLMMIFGFCITSLESYLSHIFIDKVLKNEKLKGKYIQAESRMNDF